MTKLYDYSILILMEEKRNFLDHEGIEDIFSAVAEVCMKYRNFQEEGQVLCFTWSAVSIYPFPNEFRADQVACVSIPGWYHASIPYLGNSVHEYDFPATTPST